MKNAKGKGTVWYGIHFYPGVAEYREPNKAPYRVFLNENTLREMDPTFAGRPVFVMHVDGVDDDIDVLRTDADGWVTESFYNQADGKHWVKFLAVSEKAERAIKQGMRLSNCYEPRTFGQGGLWNGVQYDREITGGEYEHLAIVPNPRYEESVILSPEEFKRYNEKCLGDLQRLANDKESKPMKLNLFKRTKVENSNEIDLDTMSVVLPKSKKEMTLTQLVNDADAAHDKENPAYGMAHPDHMVDMGEGKKMSVKDMHNAYKAMCDEMEKMKKDATEEESDLDTEKTAVDVEGDDKAKNDDADDDSDDKDAKKKALKLVDDEDKEVEAAKKKNAADEVERKRKAKEKADRLRNADSQKHETAVVVMSEDQVQRGKSRYGSAM